ncbi:Homeo [Glarea lozoyensis ATCC 20868]|uniref:Homeo n=1 Tax=Glarea lozoyensis (strain ATCC 20868 / MF5171) TaxID=1116229 RepID=S3DGP6_GLAL2|nr:Homeo [Glarea lozoyensis ATCC 20868]EPE31211.1 Homeo [Glarea lozoyensis ATCC 20868]
MDEFFDFEDAAQAFSSNQSTDLNFDIEDFGPGPYDIDLAFSEPLTDENAFTCLQHYSAAEQSNNDLVAAEHDSSMPDTAMSGGTDLLEFPKFMADPCGNCRRTGIHCKIIREGIRKGSCTSCVALGRTCSLNQQPEEKNGRVCINAGFCPPGTIQDENTDMNDWPVDDTQHSTCPTVNWVPSKSPVQESTIPQSSSAPDLAAMNDENGDGDEGGPKTGARFSREAVKVLRGWLSTHHRHPYPTDDEKESLKRLTGLNKIQITNWLANARRRGKVRAPRSTSPAVGNHPNAMDIPRKGPMATKNMNPLERWKASPPEHEPASVTAIAQAVSSSSLHSEHNSPYASYAHSDDFSNRSGVINSSASSLGTSQSSGNSFASAFSHKSKGSFGSFNSFGNRGRRRRRRAAAKPVKNLNAAGPVRTFQCTFCTETFKTKHDWQRHEKSLHLSLERWVCCPNGPAQFCAELDMNQCVFCLLPNPPKGHGETHNYSSCTDRSLEERTFYRKDHLRQHLNLVHDVKFQAGTMESWKVATPEIRSRCGFCGTVMDSWSIRVDHLAEHFKGGKSMADWKGDWGFDTQVLDIVENGMPPYLIHDERNSPQPFSSQLFSADQRTLEDLVKIGLQEYVHERFIGGLLPTDDDLVEEARRIIRKADEFTITSGSLESSWFRDLILGPEGRDYNDLHLENTGEENLLWIEKPDTNTVAQPIGDGDLATITCPLERLLMKWIVSQQMLGLTPLDSELQVQACRVLNEVETTSNFKCKPALKWFKWLITADTKWLSGLRRRACLPRSSEISHESIRTIDENAIDFTINNLQRLENEMINWVKLQKAQDIIPTDDDVQRHARMLVYKSDDPWNQTAFDEPGMLYLFKQQQGIAPTDQLGPTMPSLREPEVPPTFATSPHPSKSLHWDLQDSGPGITSPLHNRSGSNSPGFNSLKSLNHSPNNTPIVSQPTANSNHVQPLKYFLNDANCYGRLVRELSRFVTSSTSINNPNRHAPTDAEIQHQARWIVYDDDDPWNQTAADNAEWLMRFKRDVGLCEPSTGPGLPVNEKSWQLCQGGSGFGPPYVAPKENAELQFDGEVPVSMYGKVYNVSASTATKFAKGLAGRWKPPGVVFCSRELEEGLNKFMVQQISSGITPSDESIQQKAREILGQEETAADDMALLEKFKGLHGLFTSPTMPEFSSELLNFPSLNEDDFLQIFDEELAANGLDNWNSPPTNAPSRSRNMMTSPMYHSPLATIPLANFSAQGISGVGQSDNKKAPVGMARDYAEMYRVNAATASPLRRKVSVMAARERCPEGWDDEVGGDCQ